MNFVQQSDYQHIFVLHCVIDLWAYFLSSILIFPFNRVWLIMMYYDMLYDMSLLHFIKKRYVETI